MNYQTTGKEEKTDFFVSFIDILLNFRTTFVNHKGEVVTSSKDITINYIKTWFFLDLVAALPFDFLELFELNLMVSSSFKKIVQVQLELHRFVYRSPLNQFIY